jgi:hypothetical protein
MINIVSLLRRHLICEPKTGVSINLARLKELLTPGREDREKREFLSELMQDEEMARELVKAGIYEAVKEYWGISR